MYFNTMKLANNMNLDVHLTHLTKELSILGALFFKECDTDYYDEASNSMLPIHLKAKTILVDKKHAQTFK